MSIEFGIWRIDDGSKPLSLSGMGLEQQLQDLLVRDISIIDEQLTVLGEKVRTDFGGEIDILAMDRGGSLVVLELKRDKSPRDVVAQTLDYASWVDGLKPDRIADIYSSFQSGVVETGSPKPLADALGGDVPLDDLNAKHRMVVVASELDSATERIVKYLREVYGIDINVALFRAFEDSERQYIARAWLSERAPASRDSGQGGTDTVEWNGEYFVNIGEGEHRRWSDARRFGFVSAGGAKRFEDAMKRLEEGDRIWAYVSGHGYVGYGEVHTEATIGDHFIVDSKGLEQPIRKLDLDAPKAFEEGHEEWFVGVEWLMDVALGDAVWQKGMYFARGVSVRPRRQTWQETIDALKAEWAIEGEL